MSRPKFSVGEEVILCSVMRPELNGEYIIEGICEDGHVYKGVPFFTSDGIPYAYDLGIVIVGDMHPNLWSESSLRKKHKPASKGFRALMSDFLKQPATMP